MRQNSTLKQLSEILNLSVSTVSRALKDHPDVSPESKKKVRELAEALEYEPNSYAVQLRTNESKVLGVLVPTIANFFYDSFIAALEEEAHALGYSVLIMQSGDKLESETSSLQLLRRNRISGLFAAITTDTEDLAPFLKLQSLGTPVVYFDRVPAQPQCNKICLADRKSGAMAAEVLIRKNKQSVLGLFGHPHLTISQKRLEAFQETFASRAPATRLQIGFPLSTEQAYEMALRALKGDQRPEAIFCMGDLILIGVMQAVQELELSCPADVGVIAISHGFIPTLYRPRITYVETSGYKLGKLAFTRMMACLSGDESFQEFAIDSILVEGGSL